MREQEKEQLPKQVQVIMPKDFEQVDIGMYEYEAAAVLWGNKTDVLITCLDVYVEPLYRGEALTKHAKISNACLDWVEKHKNDIQQLISENSMFQWRSSSETVEENLLDRLCFRKIEMSIANGQSLELLACLYIDIKSFFFPNHCHCVEVAVYVKEDGTYNVEIIRDTRRLLLEVRDLWKAKNEEACGWAENNGIFFAFDAEGNMLAVVRQQFGLSKDKKLISLTDGNYMKRKEFSEKTTERNTLYFIWAEWSMEEDNVLWEGVSEGIPMPLGFVAKELICEEDVFTIMSSSGHNAVSGAFFVIQEAFTVIRNLYRLKGVSEEEIDQAYYTYLVEDHQRYLTRITAEKTDDIKETSGNAMQRLGMTYRYSYEEQ